MSDTPFGPLKGGRYLLAGFLLFLLLLFVGRWGVVLYVDFLWFSSEGASEVFWTRARWEWGARLLVALVTAGLTWVNLAVVAKSFQGLQIRRRFGDLVIQEQLPRAYVDWALRITCLIVAIWFAMAVPQGTGLRGLLLFHAEPWGEPDPVFGRDLGFYVFVLPVLQGLLTFGMILSVFFAGLAAAGYAGTGAIAWGNGRITIGALPRLHLGVLGGAFLLLLGVRFYLAPYTLLLEGNSAVQGIFGYADHHARIPAYRMVAFLCLVTAVAVFWSARRGRLLPFAAGGVALAFGGVLLAEVYPALIQRFQVQPNELERETPYIEDAVRFTRVGFGLHDVQRRRLELTPPDAATWDRLAERMDRLPIWTDQTLLATFRQIEARFQYYDFHQIAFDRYPAPGGGVEPVAVSVREVDPAGIPDPNWQNLHIRERYISGMGAVAGQLHRRTSEGRLPMFLTAIPPEYRAGPEVPGGLDLTRPAVYVGTRPQLHAVITGTEEGFLGPGGAEGVPGEDFPAGLTMGSIFRTAALAWRFQDANLLLASEVDRDSRLIFRRQVTERVRALAPFLFLPEAPYPVIVDGRVVWILEGFTLSRSFPLSRLHPIPGQGPVNYMRNSVKATVDAVTGETRLYLADPEDPVIRAYASGFPTLLHPIEEMPEDLRRHLRYSRYFLEAQSEVLTRYHQDNPPVFHGQQDRWAIATELGMSLQAIPYRPEYALVTLPGETEESFVLSTVFVPQGRQNLASMLAARWNPEGEGPELLLWDVPVEEQFRGPRQIEAMVEQDPEISQQFSLWRQGGSQVWTGHLHLVPVGNSLFYMEPVFLAADTDAIPEIRRFLVSDGERVVMDPTLQGAVAALSAGLQGVVGEEDPGTTVASTVPGLVQGGAALEALERAEASLRAGDWEGFGRWLTELREILRRTEPLGIP